MRQRSRLLVALAVLVVGISDLSAKSTCVGVSGVSACLLTGTDVIAVNCPSGLSCGSAANSSNWNLTPFNGKTGWHNYNSNTSDPNYNNPLGYLNALSQTVDAGITFALSSGSSLRSGDGTQMNLPWLNPTNDNGYFLAASTNSPTITMTFDNSTCSKSNCISQFSLYWGSLDSWNTIMFTPASGPAISLSGTQIANALNLGPLGQNDTASYVLNFQVPTGDSLWTAVTLSSSYPAFEFDNIEWDSVVGITNGGPLPSGATPEPTSVLLLVTGIVTVAERLRRNLHS